MKKVLYIITTLDVGGAENVLYQLLKCQNSKEWESCVLCLSAPGVFARKIRELGIQVVSFDLRARPYNLINWVRLFQFIKKFQPDVIHARMYHACFISFLSSTFVRKNRHIWSVHNTNLNLRDLGLTTWILVRLLSLLSAFPDKIIFVSHASRDTHEKIGFKLHKSIIIFNGYATEKFQPDRNRALAFRKDMGLAPETEIIGLVSRDHVQKNIDGFFEMAKFVKNLRPEVYFVCCGQGLDEENEKVSEMINSFGLEDRVFLLGVRLDMEYVYPIFDVLVLPSRGESFPNVLGEAMSCGVPCVSTDVGDASVILSEVGEIVPVENMKELANKAIETLRLSKVEKENLSIKVREKVVKKYALEKMVEQYTSNMEDG